MAAFKLRRLGGQIILAVHDELLVEAPEEHAEEAPLDLHDFTIDEEVYDAPPPRDWAMLATTALCALAAIGWLVLIGRAVSVAVALGEQRLLDPEDLIASAGEHPDDHQHASHPPMVPRVT